jgi:hypothetical protein
VTEPVKRAINFQESIKKSGESSRLKEAVEFLGVDPDDEAGIVSPAEYAQKHLMQVAYFQVVGNSDNSCHNGTDIIYV